MTTFNLSVLVFVSPGQTDAIAIGCATLLSFVLGAAWFVMFLNLHLLQGIFVLLSFNVVCDSSMMCLRRFLLAMYSFTSNIQVWASVWRSLDAANKGSIVITHAACIRISSDVLAP